MLTGRGSYIENETEFHLHPGTLFLSRPGIQHQIKSREGLALCYVAFELDESANSDLHTVAFRRLAIQGIPVLQEDAGQASGLLWLSPLSMFQSGSGGKRPAAYAEQLGASLILSILVAHGPGFYQEPSDLGAREEGASMFHQAELFIQDNLGEPLSLERVAGHLHVTTRHLTRLFRKYGHQSFVHYVQERRVRKRNTCF